MQIMSGVRFGPVRGLTVAGVGTCFPAIFGLWHEGSSLLNISGNPLVVGFPVNVLLPLFMLKLFRVDIGSNENMNGGRNMPFVWNFLLLIIFFTIAFPVFLGLESWAYRAFTFLLFVAGVALFVFRLDGNRQRFSMLTVLSISCFMSSIIGSSRAVSANGWSAVINLSIPWFLWDMVWSIYGLRILTMADSNHSRSSIQGRQIQKKSADDDSITNLPSRLSLRSLQKNGKLILVTICAILIYLLWLCKGYQLFPSWDGTYYINYSIHSVFPPGYPFFIMIFKAFVSSNVLAARIVSMFFLCGTVIIVFLLARKNASPALAMVAALFAGFAPLSLRMGIDTMSEATYTFFIVLAAYLYSLSLEKHRRRRHLFFVGLFSAIAYYTRPEAVVFFGFLLLLDAYKTRNLNGTLISLAGFATVFVPIALGTYLATGEVLVTQKAAIIIKKTLNPADWFNAEKVAWGTKQAGPLSLSKLIRSMISNYGSNFQQEVDCLITLAGVPALTFTIAYLIRSRTFLVVGLAEFFIYPIFSGLGLPERFVYPYIPFLAIMSAAAISKLVSSNMKGIAVGLLLIGTVGAYPFLKTSVETFPELKEAGCAMKKYVDQGSIILDRKPYATFYAGLKPAQNFVYIPFTNMDGVMDYAHRTKANFLVMDAAVIQIFRPLLLPMFDSNFRRKYSNSLQLLVDLHPDSSDEVLIFRIL